MLSVKIPIRILVTSLCLYLAAASSVVAQEDLLEPLPIGARVRLDRGSAVSVQYSPDGTLLAVGGSAGVWLYDARTYEVKSLLTGHTDEVWSVVFSPDGRTLASAGRDATVRLWDVATGTLWHTLEDHAKWVWNLAFSSDGRILATKDWASVVRLWDVATGTHRHTLEHHGEVLSMVFSPDGTLACGGEYGTIRVWDAATGTLRHTLEGHSHAVDRVVFSPDGRVLASQVNPIYGGGGPIRVWDAATGTLRHTLEGTLRAFSPDSRTLVGERSAWDVATGTTLHTFEHHLEGSIIIANLSPDGRILATGSSEGAVYLWNIVAGTLRHTLEGRLSRVDRMAFSPDSRILAGGNEYATDVWDVATGTLLHSFTHVSTGDRGYSEGIRGLAFSPDGRTLITRRGTSTRFWDVALGTLQHAFEHHADEVYKVLFSPDGRTLASHPSRTVPESYNFPAYREATTIRLWDVDAGTLRHAWEGHVFEGYLILVLSPDGRTLAVGSDRYPVRLWDVATGTLRHTLRHDLQSGDYEHRTQIVAFSSDGRTLATGNDEDDNVRLWDVATGALRHTLRPDLQGDSYQNRPQIVAFSPDGRTLAIGSRRGIDLWDLDSGVVRHSLDGVYREFSPDGRTLATERWGVVWLWDAATGIRQNAFEHQGGDFRIVKFSPDGRMLATGTDDDQTLLLWDVAADTLRHTLKGYQGEVESVAFSPDGQVLATGIDDGTLRLWDVATGTLRHTLTGHTDRVVSVAFSPDGRTVASGSYDGSVLLWDVVSDAAVGDFRNLVDNPDGRWEVWRSGTMVTARFSSPRAPVQYYARQNPQAQFMLPSDFRPTRQVTHTVTGTRVDAEGIPVPNAQPAIFDLTIDPNGEVRYVDNAKVDGLGYVGYHVMRLTWWTNELPEMSATSGTGVIPVSGNEPGQ